MNQYDNDTLNQQTDDLNKKVNQNTKVWDGGTYSDPSTTERDVAENDNSADASGGSRSMTPTNKSDDHDDETSSFDSDDDDDFDDTVGEDDLDDKDGFNANSDDPTERELTKTWMGNEKSVHEAEAKGLEGEPMGGHNFGTSELEQKNNRDASSSEHHSLGLGSSALNQPSEEISNPPEIEDGSDNPDRKKTYD
ncbi:MAG: hypothetical protein EOP41_01550 [Sphingobacteriaceae bacterium]|nr:MAG: hypothetical protein EOP41_01550 [Sphingobacteriaceae bacterium]